MSVVILSSQSFVDINFEEHHSVPNLKQRQPPTDLHTSNRQWFDSGAPLVFERRDWTTAYHQGQPLLNQQLHKSELQVCLEYASDWKGRNSFILDYVGLYCSLILFTFVKSKKDRERTKGQRKGQIWQSKNPEGREYIEKENRQYEMLVFSLILNI